MTAARSVRSLVLQWGFRAAVPVVRSLDHRVNGGQNFSACRHDAYPVPNDIGVRIEDLDNPEFRKIDAGERGWQL